ncbi:MAG: ABC transporter permease [Roseburia sp.]|nr:ABC transporter permease [Roseburia sp.]
MYRSKAFYVCCAVTVCGVILVYGTLFQADAIQRREDANVYISASDGSGIEEASERILEEIGIPDMLQQMFGNFGAFTVAVFACVFVIGEYGNGVVKNIVGKGYARWQIFVAKYTAAIAAGVALMILTAAVTVITGGIVQRIADVPQIWDAAFIKELLCYSCVELLLGAAVTGIIVTISELCRNFAVGISVSIGLIGFSTLLTSGIDLVVKRLFPQSQIRTADYWLVDLMTECPTQGIERQLVVHVLWVCAVWSVLAVGTGILHFKRADIQ